MLGRCKRILRIETVAAKILNDHLERFDVSGAEIFEQVLDEFEHTIRKAIKDPEIAGFKSVIAYRTGLNLPRMSPVEELKASFLRIIRTQRAQNLTHFEILENELLNAYVVHKTAALIEASSTTHKKPIQFHTGLGDKDVNLVRSSPSHPQEFIRAYPKVPIVLLHASYPWTKEAGFLATVYANVYADISEVFPFVSQDGQEKVVREILELCPTEKILWSTDGHRFPETYLLAVIQVREAFKKVCGLLICLFSDVLTI
jgi:predicted TIM-barrel fold metal-dependent hydrolase